MDTVENAVDSPLNVAEYERLAAEKLDPAAYGYFAGGAGDEVTLRENVEAFQRLRLRPRVLADVSGVSTNATVLGHDLSMPILVAPTAFQRLAHPEGEVATARAAARAGTIFCLSTVATAAPAEITEGVRWFQLYVFKDRAFTRELVERAVEAGFSAILLTADTPHLGRRERDHRTGFRVPSELIPTLVGHKLLTPEETFASMADDLSWRDVEGFASMSGLPVLVKGVLTAEDALLACESGAAGVVVSNHGGRQLDGVPATIGALPEVVDAVAGRIPCCWTAGSAAELTWSRRWHSEPMPYWPGGPSSGDSRSTERREWLRCWSSYAPSWNSRSHFSGADRRLRSPAPTLAVPAT